MCRMHGERRSAFISSVVLCLCVGISSILILTTTGENSKREVTDRIDNIIHHRSYSSDPDLYAITATSTYKQKYTDVIPGGIVSHHLLANIDIANFFAEFTDQTVDRVVIVGPNHYYPNASPLLSTTHHYTTPFGEVRVDADLISDLVGSKLVELSPKLIEEEHSISSLVPYVSAYFPSAEIVPIIVSARAPKPQLQELADYLINLNSSSTIVVASVDFSHHLYSNASVIHDLRSAVAIKNFDYDSLPKLELDSQGSIFILLKYLAGRGAQNISIQHQSSASIFNEYDSEDVTSYVFAHARTGDIQESGGVSALFFGDTMLGRGVANNKKLFSNIRGPEGNFLRGYDAVIVNLEGAVASAGCDIEDDELLILPVDLAVLRDNYVTHVGIMNNHFGRCIYDDQVQEAFNKAKLTPVTDRGTTIAGTNAQIEVISFFASPIPKDTSIMLERVKEASATGKTVVVYTHWGVEYTTKPAESEKEFARAIIDAGASAVIGHHPHVVQPIEVYKDRPIFYSVGNFMTDQQGQLTNEGLAVGLYATDEGYRYVLFPYVQKNGVPTHLSQSDSRLYCGKYYEGAPRFQSLDHPCILIFEK